MCSYWNVLWVELHPFLPRYVEVINPSTSECDLLWKQGLWRGNQLRIKSSGWDLIQYDQYPYIKGKSGHRPRQTQRQGLDWYNWAKDPQILQTLPEARKPQGWILSRVSEGAWLSSLENTETGNSPSEATQYGVFCYVNFANEYRTQIMFYDTLF